MRGALLLAGVLFGGVAGVLLDVTGSWQGLAGMVLASFGGMMVREALS